MPVDLETKNSTPRTPRPRISQPALLRERLAEWYRANARDLPWRRTRDPYAILVSEFMLQQTQVVTVIPFYERWLARFPDFATLATATEAEVLALWQGLGYYSRARNLHRAAQQVVADFGGTLPADAGKIRELPGVGAYTAGAIASFAFDHSVVTIDANIARVLARLIDLQEPIDTAAGAGALAAAAELLLPKTNGGGHTSALMELGALICTPARPRCHACPIRGTCRATDPDRLPIKRPRARTVAMREDCGWIVQGRRVLLEQQTGARWRGLWKLPVLVPPVPAAEPLTFLIYPFTHHRVSLSVYPAAPPRQLAGNQQWFLLAELTGVALAAPHRRAVETLAKTAAAAR